MTLTQMSEPEHTGTERYEIWFTFDEEDRKIFYGRSDQYDLVPEEVCLVWTRERGKPWRRDPTRRSGSRAIGYSKPSPFRPEQLRGRAVWRQLYVENTERTFRSIVLDLPGLVDLIADVEAALPQ